MTSRAIDPVDTIWLNMDRANNLMVIESLMMLEGQVDWDRFLTVLQQRVLGVYPVFSQRAVPARLPLLPPHWEDDTDFSLSRHIHRATLPAPGDDAALQEFVSSQLSTALPRDRPLWQIHLIDGYGQGSAVYSRLHHAMADGMALMQVLLSLTDEVADPAVVPSPAVVSDRGPLSALVHLVGAAGTALLDAPRLLTTAHTGDVVKTAWQSAGVTTKLLRAHNPNSAVAGEATPSKAAIWAPPIPLADIAALGHRTGTTVNDVLMAALAGALSTYLGNGTGSGATPDIPTMVPVNLRPVDQPLPRELGNRFALVLFSLPSSLDTPFARLAETKRRMDDIKHSPEAALTLGMIQGIGRTGPELERLVVDFFANKATGVTTNVPGPRTPRYVAGSRISGMLGWAPESGNQALGTAIFSYDGAVSVGFKVDTGVISHPEELVAAFVAEIDALCHLATTG